MRVILGILAFLTVVIIGVAILVNEWFKTRKKLR